MKIKSSFTHPGVVLLHYAHLSFSDYKRKNGSIFKKKYIPRVQGVYDRVW